MWNGLKISDILDWLEKKGETFTKKDVDDAYLKGVCDTKQELEKQGRQKPTDNVIEEEKSLLEKFKQAVYDCAWGKVTCKKEGETKEEYANRWAEHFLFMVRDWADDYIDFTIQQKLRNSYEKGKTDIIEKQGEQKPANKVEPKFKDGEWVVNTVGDTNQVVKVLDDGYTLDDNTFLSNSWATEHYHLWTIQEAKEGDVLVVNNEVFIYAHRKQMYSIAVAHCFVDSAGGFYFDGEFGYTENGNSIHPATKEQRDLLFKKMHEAGYEWDAKKKELKKIDQKPAWSEDDELIRNALINIVRGVASNQGYEGFVDWLKSLKDRMQPKQEWSEDDKRKLNTVCSLMYSNPAQDPFYAKVSLENWLKSLRPQKQWKPSEGQLECLGYAIDKAEKDYSPLVNNRIYLTLKALKEQLTKLKD
jgi:hypothetical protein